MAPPRRTAAAVDDAKADGTVTSTTKSGTTSRSRKNAASSAAKAAAAENNAASGTATDPQQQQQQPQPQTQQQQKQQQQQHQVCCDEKAWPGIIAWSPGLLISKSQVDWSSMPISVLHDYRYAYNLQCPSSYGSQIAQIYLSQGIGLQSPTAIAARRAQRAEHQRKSELGNHHNTRRLSTTNGHDQYSLQGLRKEKEFSNGAGLKTKNAPNYNMPVYALHRTMSPGAHQSHLVQGRVSKDHLASNVRRHFNSCGLVEQDAIARFLYKVREERKGKEFRIRFSP